MNTTLSKPIIQTASHPFYWSVNSETSKIYFEIQQRNLLGGKARTVVGTFKDYSGLMESGREDFSGADVRFSIVTNSIDTGNTRRDKHLSSAAFLNHTDQPLIRFLGTSFEKRNSGHYSLEGNCIINGTARLISFDVIYTGTKKDPSGSPVAAFKASAVINRHDFGVKSNIFFEALISKKVSVQLNLEFFQIK